MEDQNGKNKIEFDNVMYKIVYTLKQILIKINFFLKKNRK